MQLQQIPMFGKEQSSQPNLICREPSHPKWISGVFLDLYFDNFPTGAGQMESYERDTVRLWRVHKTAHHMVHDRGYVVSQAELDMSLADFASSYGVGGSIVDRGGLNFVVQSKANPADQLYVFFPEDPAVGVKTIRG